MLNASWYKIVSLSALQGSIVLAWVIYNIYLPKLLISCGLSPRLAISLIIIENAIAFILEPLFGSLSDRAYRWIATKFGFIVIPNKNETLSNAVISNNLIYRST
jgi:hypothetical protein